MIQIECLHGTKFLHPDRYLDCDLDNFAPCKWYYTNFKQGSIPKAKLRVCFPIRKDFSQLDVFICSALNIAPENKNIYD